MADDLVVNGYVIGDIEPYTYSPGNLVLSTASGADAIANGPSMEASENGALTRALLAVLLDKKSTESYKQDLLKRAAYSQYQRAQKLTRETYFDLMYENVSRARSWDGKADKLAVDALTPIAALYHYVRGDGSRMSMNLADLGVNTGISALTPVSSALSKGAGTYNIANDYGYNFSTAAKESVNFEQFALAATLGRISLRTEGKLTIQSNGQWSYTGVVRAYSDTYDANPDASRGVIGDLSTAALAAMNGKPFTIDLPGQLNVYITGKK